MRVTKEQAEENRAALVAAAARLFRARGFDAVGVAEIARAAGLTHGAFYSHFASKEALAAAACTQGVEDAAAYWNDVAASNRRAPRTAIVRGYLAAAHRDMPGTLCTFAALGSDLARSPDAVRAAATRALDQQIDVLAATMPGRTRASRRKQALAAYAAMIGAMVMARAVDDPALSDAFLEAGMERALAA